MNIALDFDDTYTRDPELWGNFVRQALRTGHDIRFVTFRSENGRNEDIHFAAADLHIPVIFTGGMAKRRYCYQNDFFVQVWIDDMPEIIVDHEAYHNFPQNLIRMAVEEN